MKAIINAIFILRFIF